MSIVTSQSHLDSGALWLSSGRSSNGATGEIRLETGTSEKDSAGSVVLIAGPSHSGVSGAVLLQAGTGYNGLSGGQMLLISGESSFRTGDILISTMCSGFSGTEMHCSESVSEQSGSVFIQTSNASITGDIQLSVGSSLGKWAGSVYLKAGDLTENSEFAGSLVAVGGSDISDSSDGTSTGGNVSISAGASLHGIGGILNFKAGNSGSSTGGHVHVVSGSSGALSGSVLVSSANSSMGNSGSVQINTGSVLQISGDLTVFTGEGDVSGNVSVSSGRSIDTSGEITLFSGSSKTGVSGRVRVSSGQSFSDTSGILEIRSGEAFLRSGFVIVESSAAEYSGNIRIESGAAKLSSGNVSISSGTATGGQPGSLFLLTGSSHGQLSGDIVIRVSESSCSSGGSVLIESGSADGYVDTNGGPIYLISGHSASGFGGEISITSGYGFLRSGNLLLSSGLAESSGSLKQVKQNQEVFI